MIEFIEEALVLLWGDYAFTSYPTIFDSLLNIMLSIFGVIIVVCAIKLFKYLLFGWWH